MVTGIEGALVEKAVKLATEIVGFLLGQAKEKVARQRAQKALAYALAMEVSELVIAVARRHDWWTNRPVQPEAWLPPLVPFYTETFDVARARLDTLPTELVAPLVRFYGYVRFLNSQGTLLDAYASASRHAEFHGTYATALATLLTIGSETLTTFSRFLKLDAGRVPAARTKPEPPRSKRRGIP